jgi:hypothetical protein
MAMIDQTQQKVDETARTIEDQAKDTSKRNKTMIPLIIGGVAGLALMVRQFAKGSKKNSSQFTSHSHQALQHDHPHVHVTHERSDPEAPVGGWSHLTAEHSHMHNHAAMQHSHRPHRDFEAEHVREAHVHDHEHPARS